MAANQEGSYLVADFDILINGESLPVSVRTRVIQVVVDQDVSMPDMFTFTVRGSADQQKEHPWEDDALFSVGNSVEVKMKYEDKLISLLTGEVTGLEPSFAHDSLPLLTVRGYDRLHRLHHGQKTRTFIKQKDSQIAAAIASEYGLSGEAEDSQVEHEYVTQINQSDMAFLMERARRIHYELLVNDRKLIFRPNKSDAGKTINLALKTDLLNFNPRLSTIRQVSGVNVRSWDPAAKDKIIAETEKGDEGSTMGGQTSGAAISQDAFNLEATLIDDRPAASQAEADQIAKARFRASSLRLITGSGRCIGRPDLKAGLVVEIDGCGKRFNGCYYITSARHCYQSGGPYYTHFRVQRNAI